MTFDAVNLTLGVYTANICVNTNGHWWLPVTFNVAGDANLIFVDGFDRSPPR